MKKYLSIALLTSAMSLGFVNTSSANPAFAMAIAPQAFQFLPQILPIFGQIFSGFGGTNGTAIVNQGAYTSYGDEEEYHPRHHRSQPSRASRRYDDSNNGY